MLSSRKQAEEDKRRAREAYRPQPLDKMKYVIIDNKRYARYYFENFKDYKYKMDKFRQEFPKEYKTRFKTLRQNV